MKPLAVETVAYLREHCPQVKVVMLTAYSDEAHVRKLVAAGVAGYVLKDEIEEAVVQATFQHCLCEHTSPGGTKSKPGHTPPGFLFGAANVQPLRVSGCTSPIEN